MRETLLVSLVEFSFLVQKMYIACTEECSYLI